jgi:hypothetical protein
MVITFLLENRAVYEIVWKHIVQPGRPQMIRWHMCIVCWISKATNTRSEYVILIAFPLKQWLHELPSLLRCTITKTVMQFAVNLPSLSETLLGQS